MRLRGIEGKSFLRESLFAILPGQYFDAETGLHQNWHRDYDPSIGRYLQADPLGSLPGLVLPPTLHEGVARRYARYIGGFNHSYLYASNDPEGSIDPEGLSDKSVNKKPTFKIPKPNLDSAVGRLLATPCAIRECEKRCRWAPPYPLDPTLECMSQFSRLPEEQQQALIVAMRVTMMGDEAGVIIECADMLKKLFPSRRENPCECN